MFFLDLLHISGRKKYASMIYGLILTSLNQWVWIWISFVGFGSDGAYVMTEIRNGVVARLKDKVNPFNLSIHCVAHRTNFASLDAANSASCKNLSIFLDNLINNTASHLKKSNKAKSSLNELQEELYDA